MNKKEIVEKWVNLNNSATKNLWVYKELGVLRKKLPQYSTNMHDAMDAVSVILNHPDHYAAFSLSGEKGHYECQLVCTKDNSSEKETWWVGPTAAQATCLAVLLYLNEHPVNNESELDDVE